MAADAAQSPSRTTILRAQCPPHPARPLRGDARPRLSRERRGRVPGRRNPRDWRLRRGSGRHPDADVIDKRDAFLLPGLVDTHVHWPQLGVIGAMGSGCSTGSRTRTLPEEVGLADLDYARPLARDFVRGLAANGTTTALVFGPHFPDAQEAFFEAAARAACGSRAGSSSPTATSSPSCARSRRRPTRPRSRSAAAGTDTAASATPSRRASRSPAPRRCSSPAPLWRPSSTARSSRAT